MRLDKHVAIIGSGIHLTFDADEMKGDREERLDERALAPQPYNDLQGLCDTYR